MEFQNTITIGGIIIDFSVLEDEVGFKRVNLENIGGFTYFFGYYAFANTANNTLGFTQLSNYNSLYFYADKDYDIYISEDDLNNCEYISITTIENPSQIESNGANYFIKGENPIRYRKSDNNIPTSERPLHIKKGEFVAFSKSINDQFVFYVSYDGIEKDFIKKSKVVYKKINESNSKEKISVYIPTNKGYVEYDFRHNVNITDNANSWEIFKVYHCDNELNQIKNITETGEWECAIKLSGRSDFSGGILHGDELMDSITFTIDGKDMQPNEINKLTNFEEIKIMEKSKLFDPKDSKTVIANHSRNYTINLEGIEIKQSLEWLVSETLDLSYMGMFPISKSVTNKIYTNLSDQRFEIVNGMAFDGATKATIYSEEEQVYGEFEVIKSPRNYIFIQDNGGNLYNKLYLAVCNQGDKSSINDVWESIIKYKITIGK